MRSLKKSKGNDDHQGSTHMQRTLNNLISYLDQKSAAGVISLPDDANALANLNIFTPRSHFAKKLFEQLIPKLNIVSTDTNYLVIVLLKNNVSL